MEFTNLNFIVKKLQSTINWSKLANFASLKLMLVGKPTILNKMA